MPHNSDTRASAGAGRFAGLGVPDIAEDDLGEILRYVAEQDGVERALHVHDEFVEAFDQLASMPGFGARRPELTGDRMRRWTVFRWIVIYDPETSPITIVRVVHGKFVGAFEQLASRSVRPVPSNSRRCARPRCCGRSRPELRHSVEETRFLRLGRSARGQVLMVAYTLRRSGNVEAIRIISARQASR